MSAERKPPLVEAEWVAHGLDCLVLRMEIGHPCGYVRIPESHPWFGVGYSARVPGLIGPLDRYDAEWETVPYEMTTGAQVEVHGGVTFAGKFHSGVRDGWWFGFDCAHSGDWSTWEPSGRKWTPEDLVAETASLARQIAAAGVAA